MTVGISLPRDANGNTIMLSPGVIPNAVHLDNTVSTSTEFTINAKTTLIEINSLVAGVFLKWGANNVSTSDFHEYVGANSAKTYVVPINQATGLPYTTFSLVQDEGVAKVRIVEK